MKSATINIREIEVNGNIIKPTYHLNIGKLRISTSLKNGVKSRTLKDVTSDVFTGGIFKRVFIENSEFGIPYISAQHMMHFNPRGEAKIISKKYTPRVSEMTLTEGQILVSCAGSPGSIGNIRYISKDMNGLLGSQDIIRVMPDESKLPAGFLYAYLASSTIYNYIQSYIYGSVIPRIEPKTLSKLPILDFPKKLIANVDELIKQSNELRAKANLDLAKAQQILEDNIFEKSQEKYYSTKFMSSSKLLSGFNKRIDANFHIYKTQIEQRFRKSIKKVPLVDLVKTPMYTAQRGKRNYVTNGIQFLSTGDISEINPLLVNKFLSWQTDGLKTLIVNDNWILVASSGSEILGSAFLVDQTFDKSAVNQHSIRVIIDESKVSPLYVFAYLSCNKIKDYVRSGIYGSAILTINETFLGTIEVPIIGEENTKTIIELAQSFKTKKQKASFLEKEAIDLIENQIESWQK